MYKMAERIIDILTTLGVLAYLLVKHRDNIDWYSLLLIYIILNIVFVVVTILYVSNYLDISVHILNTVSRSLKWYIVSTAIYYAKKGER